MSKALVLSALLTCVLTVSCSPLVKVVRQDPEAPIPAAFHGGDALPPRTFVSAREHLSDAEGIQALGTLVTAAETASRRLKKDPVNADALEAYRYAVSRLFTVFRRADIFPSPRPLQVGGRSLEWMSDDRTMWNPADYDFFPVDELRLGGRIFQKPVRRAGLGAPLVAIRKKPMRDFRKLYLGSENVYYGVTAVARFEGARCVLSLEDPLAAETVRSEGRTFPLAGDFTTALAMLIEKDRPDKLGLSRLLRPGKYDHTTMLYRMQPFDPERIPVIFVHGLDSTPATWLPMFNALMGDAQIRQKFQFWFFSYPSGYPFAYSASLLRREMDGISKVYPHKPVVMVGHSMGGLLTRLMLTRSGENIWRSIFRHSPEETKLLPGTRKLMRESLLFEPRSDVARAVFCCTPHRGSELASSWIGLLSSRLVQLPGNLLDAGNDVITGGVLAHSGVRFRRLPDSVRTLSPAAPFVMAMNKLPLEPGVPFHEIIGDRGKKNSPDSSDGVVPYWSSHLDGSKSSLIVPSGHSSHASPEAITEIRRILREHVGLNPPD